MNTTKKKQVWILVVLTHVFFSNYALAEWSCPNKDQEQVVIGVGYDNKYYQPRIHFASQPPGYWTYLAYHYGVRSNYAKSMLATALTAYVTGRKIKVDCVINSGASGAPTVNSIWMSDSGSVPPS
ncbi:hypothetical protein [Dyella choica]|uniref:Uncharacterized protein n=1 Tax=Dyella choica TaxID=1927959 RepID=A0A432M5D8_9GAMM|nr:hypothetical protein [Dyella choica]RUL75277.1 hypothetical protein EKH80_11130 [Dyella choica]